MRGVGEPLKRKEGVCLKGEDVNLAGAPSHCDPGAVSGSRCPSGEQLITDSAPRGLLSARPGREDSVCGSGSWLGPGIQRIRTHMQCDGYLSFRREAALCLIKALWVPRPHLMS